MTIPPQRESQGATPSPSSWTPAGGFPAPMRPVAVAHPVPPPEVRGRRGGWAMLGVFAAAEVTFLLVSLLALVPFVIVDPGLSDGPLPGGALLVALAVPTVLAALVALGGTRLLGGGPAAGRLRRELAVGCSWRDLGIGLALGTGGMLLTIPASLIWAWWVGEDQANSAVGELFDGQALFPVTAVAVFLVVWLVAPLCEEVLFRGVLWRALEHWRWNRWLIFGVTTVGFAFLHFELLRTPLLVVISIPIGLARMLTGNLLASVVAHQANNFVPALGLLLITLGVVPA
ncbi:MAG TPA: type II CAAX endopeptidase family protein [Pseudonocardiaceae bacterium]|nr:type II CAAX endopeptidase family protein [Pseudonocardiaceae bacterium]